MSRKNLDAVLTHGLNPQQARAVTSEHPRLLLIAGAGAGKTAVLTRRVVNLIARGVPPELILCVTFTRTAAGEMAERIERLLHEHLPGATVPEIRTLHAWGAQMIRRYADHFGLTPDFSVYDEKDREDVVRLVARERNHKSWERGKLETLLKDDGVRNGYAERLLTGNAIDFDMIERYTLRLIEEHPEVQTRWTQFYRHVLVDEYQDTNLAQVAILRGVRPDNLCVVGDPRQCQPAGTMVQTPTGPRPIESLRNGDVVTGWSRRSAFVGGTRRVEVTCRPYTGRLLTIQTSSGRGTTCTDTHRWVARWPDEARGLSAVYLMRRTFDDQPAYRVGWCKLLDESGGFRLHHYKLRARLEQAEALWLVMLHASRPEASAWESILAARYGIPTVMFNPVKGNRLYTREILDLIWRECAETSTAGAEALADSYSLHLDKPLWTPAVPTGRQTLFECIGANLRIGMAIPVWDGERSYTWETITSIASEWVEDESVYSLDVEVDHAYVANGICTLNSIYKFRGAEVKTIVEHARDADFELIELTANYRSVPEVVAYGNGCVDGDWAPMVSGRTDVGEATEPRVSGFTFRHEPALVAGLVRELRARGRRWGDIAVLARNWAALEAIRDNLSAGGIPVNFCGQDEDPWATDDGRAVARALLLAHNGNDDNLAALLSEWGALGRRRFASLAALRIEALRARRSLLWTMSLHDPEWERAFAKLNTRLVGTWSPADHVRAFLDGLGVLDTYTERGLSTRVATITGLLAELPKRCSTLEEFAEWWMGRSQVERLDTTRDAVHVLTVHGAKGLEWPVVVLADARAGVFPTGRVKATDEDRAEDLRVFYVGVTRARDQLLVTCPTRVKDPWTGAVEPATPSPFLDRPGGPGRALTEWRPVRWGGALPSSWTSV